MGLQRLVLDRPGEQRDSGRTYSDVGVLVQRAKEHRHSRRDVRHRLHELKVPRERRQALLVTLERPQHRWLQHNSLRNPGLDAGLVRQLRPRAEDNEPFTETVPMLAQRVRYPSQKELYPGLKDMWVPDPAAAVRRATRKVDPNAINLHSLTVPRGSTVAFTPSPPPISIEDH